MHKLLIVLAIVYLNSAFALDSPDKMVFGNPSTVYDDNGKSKETLIKGTTQHLTDDVQEGLDDIIDGTSENLIVVSEKEDPLGPLGGKNVSENDPIDPLGGKKKPSPPPEDPIGPFGGNLTKFFAGLIGFSSDGYNIWKLFYTVFLPLLSIFVVLFLFKGRIKKMMGLKKKHKKHKKKASSEEEA